jgi:hypothetical protein
MSSKALARLWPRIDAAVVMSTPLVTRMLAVRRRKSWSVTATSSLARLASRLSERSALRSPYGADVGGKS